LYFPHLFIGHSASLDVLAAEFMTVQVFLRIISNVPEDLNFPPTISRNFRDIILPLALWPCGRLSL